MSTQSISNKAISKRAREEGGPCKGSETSQLQSQATKEFNAQKAKQEVVAKMEGPEPVTVEDASYVQSREQKAMGGQRPPAGSVSAQAQSQSTKDMNFQKALQEVISKLLDDASSITMEDVDTLRNHTDKTSVGHAENIVAAVEIFASANEKAQADGMSKPAQAVLLPTTAPTTESQKAPIAHAASQAHIGLKTLREIATKVHAEIDANPRSVTNEDLKLYQSVVSKMQKTLGVNTAGASHPKLEEELQNEIAKVEPKVESGTVTMEEANHLHSLEARAHGYTEKGGVTAHAQSVAAKKARSVSIGTANNTPTNASDIQGPTGRPDPAEQSHRAKEANFENVVAAVKPKLENAPEMVTKDDAKLLHSREVRVQGGAEKRGIAAQAMSLAAKNETGASA